MVNSKSSTSLITNGLCGIIGTEAGYGFGFFSRTDKQQNIPFILKLDLVRYLFSDLLYIYLS